MKTIKLNHPAAEAIKSGQMTSTWRLYDDKDLSVDDRVTLIDKVKPRDHDSWVAFGEAIIERVVEKRLSEVSKHDFGAHEPYQSPEEMLAVLRSRYGPSVKLSTPVKIIHFEFKPYHDKPLVEPSMTTAGPTVTLAKQVKLYADGGSRGNPGPSASGFVLYGPGDKVLVDKGVYLGITTNNQAEYMALKLGLEEAKAIGAQQIDVFMDSLLVVNQMKGIFKIKNRDLWPIHDAIKQQLKSFKKVSFTQVPRELNKAADAAVNRALDAQISHDQDRRVL